MKVVKEENNGGMGMLIVSFLDEEDLIFGEWVGENIITKEMDYRGDMDNIFRFTCVI